MIYTYLDRGTIFESSFFFFVKRRGCEKSVDQPIELLQQLELIFKIVK